MEFNLGYISCKCPLRVAKRFFCLTCVQASICSGDFGQCEDTIFFNPTVLKCFAFSNPYEQRVFTNRRCVTFCVGSERLW